MLIIRENFVLLIKVHCVATALPIFTERIREKWLEMEEIIV